MGTVSCRRCAECETYLHHWIDDLRDPDGDEFLPGDYGCKHCGARGQQCSACDGTGCWNDSRNCSLCKGEGVVQMSELEVDHEMQLWASPDVGHSPRGNTL
jgi:hypothetical protein